jgi:DNA-binding transcriptional regulator PaaX
MPKAPAFVRSYPLSPKAAAHTLQVFRAGLESLGGLPWPSLEGIRDLALFAGIGDGAVRTALSRAKSEGSLLVEADAQGRSRYRLAPANFEMGAAQIHVERRLEGFLLAVFSFKSEENEARSALRGLLKGYGFRKLAQNTYIHGRIATEGLRAAVRAIGLDRHFFLFTCPEIDDEDLVARILALFDIEARAKELKADLARLKAFLPAELREEELARRLLYVGAVHWELVEAGEPPFPAKHLPPDYPLAEIQRFYGLRLEEGRKSLLEYYGRINR